MRKLRWINKVQVDTRYSVGFEKLHRNDVPISFTLRLMALKSSVYSTGNMMYDRLYNVCVVRQETPIKISDSKLEPTEIQQATESIGLHPVSADTHPATNKSIR